MVHNKATRDWLDALTAPEPGEQVPSQDDYPWNPQARTTTETVLREAMQALVRVQAHMLERIVVEIRAADIAVELEPYHGTMAVYRDVFYQKMVCWQRPTTIWYSSTMVVSPLHLSACISSRFGDNVIMLIN
jgi:hypothetical protein